MNFPHLLTWSYIASTNVNLNQNLGLPESHPKLFVEGYTTTVKNEFLDYIGHQNLSLGVETHYPPSNFFHLVQNKLL